MVREALNLETLGALGPRNAAALFIARRAEGLTPSEQQLLSDWLARDEAHRRVFDSADRAWQSFAEADADADEILGAMRAHARTPRRRALPAWRPMVAAAAAVLVAIGGALVLFHPWIPAITEIQYASAREVKELVLPDGSSMTLDAQSSAVGHFGADTRTIDLKQGRAFFAVMPDPSRPFAVSTGDRRIVAVGTRFDVNLAAGSLTVTLLDGQLRIESLDPGVAPVLLEPGQQYVQRPSEPPATRVVGAAGEAATSWRTGQFSFDSQTLAEIVQVANRYSSTRIVIPDADVAAIRMSGNISVGDAQHVADTLADKYYLKAARHGDEIYLTRE